MSGDIPQDADHQFEHREAGHASPAQVPDAASHDLLREQVAQARTLLEQLEESASDPAPPGQPEPGERLQQLETQLAALQAENESLRSQSMRIAADFDNFRKRQIRDQDDQRLQITCTTLSEILPVVDNFDRARQQLNPQSEEAQALHRSYQGLYKQLVDVLKQLGVSPMRVEGVPFDPNLHEAVMREESHEHPEDVVTEELQRGYQLNERVLRHALVKVSMGPGPAGAGSPEQGG
ncbi:MAG: nucleotide exchange factor GrpE [Cyanobium sp.]